ncbi:dihydrodipicolinate synthase family protein [Ponticaulis koreensis]|uniref:dihydrodipicolinate synthase family protein n=1 Tax=Ponticaulis koreensis TaxID=1123045 RepID=UPI0003B38DCE|nr:dihydrodipicolinate synthase family protein [Ponticaulis koreensis]
MQSQSETGGQNLVNRRRLMQVAGLSATAPLFVAGAASATPSSDESYGFTETDASTPQRRWAHDNLKGLLNLFLPTFQADGHTLDEEGIRHDVNHAIAMGFSGTLPLVNWTLQEDPRWEQYHRIILDEARGRIPVHGIVYNTTPEADIALLNRLEALGVDMVLLASRYATDISAEDLYASMAQRIQSTDLPIMLYAALNRGRNFPHLGPAGQPLDVFDRVADFGNVTSVKISQPVTLTSTLQMCDRLADRLLMAPVNLDFVPLLSQHYRIQWSGQWNGEAVQTPTEQLGNDLLNACASRDMARINAAAERIQPVHDAFFQLQSEVIRAGAHPWQHNKYYSWLGGGNGGLLPVSASEADHVPVLDAAARQKIRTTFAAAGLTMTDAPEEQFIVGRAAWARGVRPSDMEHWPRYAV